MKQIFPIKTQTSCLLKWGWSTIYLDKAATSSCHRCHKHEFDINDFGSFHNTNLKQDNRKLMLAGQWPQQGCQYCSKQEEAGGISDRQFQLLEQQDSGLTPHELHTDPTAINVTPTMLEVYFRNTCNQKCIYCGPADSSLWESELAKFGDMSRFSRRLSLNRDLNPLDPDTYQQALKNLWTYLESVYPHLRRFGILGGEPFLQQSEMDQTLEFWENHPNPNLVLYIISNLNLPEKLMTRYYQKFKSLVEEKKVWKVQITASLDGWGPPQEYTRFGLDLNLWRQNFENLIRQSWSTVSINSVISALTIHTLPELMKLINHWNSLRPPGAEPIIYSFNTSQESLEAPTVFGHGVFEDVFDQVLDLMPCDTDSQRNIKSHMESIKLKISSQDRNVKKIQHLKVYLDELDKRRNTNWKETFPWLIDL